MQVTSTWYPQLRRTAGPISRPWTTYLLLLGILLVLIVEVVLSVQGANLRTFMHTYGLVSADFSWTNPAAYLPLVTFNFLHSSAKHFAANTIIMLFAGAAVEKHAGRRATLLIWVAGGIAGGIAHLFLFPDSTKSLVGASGAIAAMLGAAFVIGWRWALPVKLWRGRRVLFSIPLPLVTAIWVAFQIHGFVRVSLANPEATTVATWVHLAGFMFGALVALAMYFLKQRAPVALPMPAAGGD